MGPNGCQLSVKFYLSVSSTIFRPLSVVKFSQNLKFRRVCQLSIRLVCQLSVKNMDDCQ